MESKVYERGMKNNYFILNPKLEQLVFCIEGYGAQYFALNCKKSSINGKHYPEICYAVGKDRKTIHYCNKFNMKKTFSGRLFIDNETLESFR